MGELITRTSHVETLIFDISEDNDLTSRSFNFGEYAGGMLIMPASWTAADLTFKVCDTSGGTFVDAYDKDGTQIKLTSPSASRAYEIPPALFGAAWVKLGSSVAQLADRDIVLMLKG